jgi:WD40 repeat protein
MARDEILLLPPLATLASWRLKGQQFLTDQRMQKSPKGVKNVRAMMSIAIVLTATVGSAFAQAAPATSIHATLKARLSGHTHKIITIAVSPDGETVATGSEDGTVRLWNSRTGEPRATLNLAHSYQWLSLAWSPDGRALAVNGGWSVERPQIWDARTGKLITELATNKVRKLTWSSDSKMLLTTRTDDSIAKLWEAETGRQLATLDQDPPCPKMSFWKRLYENQGADPNCQKAFHMSAQFAADGRTIITASDVHDAKLWDAASGKLKTVMPLRGEEFAERTYQSDVVLSPDQRLVARYINKEVILLDTLTGEVKYSLGQIGLPMAFSPDSQLLLTSIRKPTDSTLGKWDEFKLYDIATGELRLAFERTYLIVFRNELQWSRDGRTIMVGRGSATLLDARTGKINGDVSYGGCTPDTLIGDSGCQPMILNADGRIASKVTNPIRLWSGSGASPTTLDNAHAPAQFSPTDPHVLITRSIDKRTALLWEVLVN